MGVNGCGERPGYVASAGRYRQCLCRLRYVAGRELTGLLNALDSARDISGYRTLRAFARPRAACVLPSALPSLLLHVADQLSCLRILRRADNTVSIRFEPPRARSLTGRMEDNSRRGDCHARFLADQGVGRVQRHRLQLALS